MSKEIEQRLDRKVTHLAALETVGLPTDRSLTPLELALDNEDVQRVMDGIQTYVIEKGITELDEVRKLLGEETIEEAARAFRYSRINGESTLNTIRLMMTDVLRIKDPTMYFTIEARCSGDHPGVHEPQEHVFNEERLLSDADIREYTQDPNHHKFESDIVCVLNSRPFPTIASYFTTLPRRLAQMHEESKRAKIHRTNVHKKPVAYRRAGEAIGRIEDEIAAFNRAQHYSGIGTRIKQISALEKLTDLALAIDHSGKQRDHLLDGVLHDMFGIKILTGTNEDAKKAYQLTLKNRSLQPLDNERNYIDAASAKASGIEFVGRTFLYGALPVEFQFQTWDNYLLDKEDHPRYKERLTKGRLAFEKSALEEGNISPYHLLHILGELFNERVYIPRRALYKPA